MITGEGGSGGALALAVADRVLMLENAVYSVISPEGCAAILWPDRSAAPQAARALRLTAPDLLPARGGRRGRVGAVECRARRPGGDRPPVARRAAGQPLPLLDVPPAMLVRLRRQRFRRFGANRVGARAGLR